MLFYLYIGLSGLFFINLVKPPNHQLTFERIMKTSYRIFRSPSFRKGTKLLFIWKPLGINETIPTVIGAFLVFLFCMVSFDDVKNIFHIVSGHLDGIQLQDVFFQTSIRAPTPS
jgi:hypothetical protein